MQVANLQLPIPLDILREILQSHGVIQASVFGSYARGQARTDSDLDILVHYSEGVSLFDHLDLKDQLEQKSGKSVDIVSARAVSRHLRPYIDKEKVVIL